MFAAGCSDRPLDSLAQADKIAPGAAQRFVAKCLDRPPESLAQAQQIALWAAEPAEQFALRTLAQATAAAGTGRPPVPLPDASTQTPTTTGGVLFPERYSHSHIVCDCSCALFQQILSQHNM